MSGGGGAPPPVQDNSLQIAQMQQQQQINAQHDAENKAAGDAATFSTNMGNAQTAAQGAASTYLANRGLDPTQYMPYLQQAISTQAAKVPQNDPNPASYFTDDLFDSALNTQQQNQQTKNTSAVKGAFAPGFESTYLPESLTSSYVNSILGTQQDAADKAITASQQRGQLTDVGLAGAKAAENSQAAGARSTVQAAADSVLGKDRGSLDTFRDQATQGANDWQVGDAAFSTDPYTTEMQTQLGTEKDALGGDITNALGATPLFNVNSILLGGAQSQGPQNLTTASVPGMPVKPSTQLTNRGLGSTGAF